MNAKQFSDAMSELDPKYVDEALNYRKKAKQPGWIRWGAMAACLCLVIAGGAVFLRNGNSAVPNPDYVQIPNPIVEVATVDEMEQYLDFDVPVLNKEAASYSVLVLDNHPTMGQIDYADGSTFRMQYGSGDISGIYGGTLEESREIDGVEVRYYQYADQYAETTYAIWEQNGFTFSYVYVADGGAEVEALIQQCK